MFSVRNILLSVKNINTKRILCSVFKRHNILSDSIGIHYYIDNYKIINIY